MNSILKKGVERRKDKSNVVIVIPVHSADPSAYELISFKQCFNVLGRHPIKILAPIGLELTKYQAVVAGFETIFIDQKWQSDVQKYNKLKTSRFFYNLFKDYQFLLTYELDAFVFKDELDYWCSKNYDYIGAPWFENYIDASPDAKIIGVGNSGFSLRKVQPIRKLLKKIFYKNPLEYKADQSTLIKAKLKAPFRWVLNQFNENYTVQKNFQYNEDVFFSEVAPLYESTFNVAPVTEAIQFSFEVNPEVLFALNNYTLPMGCHAWWRYDFDFWRPYVLGYGHAL